VRSGLKYGSRKLDLVVNSKKKNNLENNLFVPKNTGKVLFFPVLPNIRKTVTMKVLRLRPLVLLIKRIVR
jgi:hypothetical protein